MEWQRDGAIWVPKGVEPEDLGGKTSRLLTHQSALLKHFSLPFSVAFPWQLFVDVYRRSNLSAEKSLEYGFKIDYNDISFLNEAEFNEVSFAIPFFQRPFFRSSSPDEDSIETRMAGVYESEAAGASFERTCSTEGVEEAKRIRNVQWQANPAWVAASYFRPLGVGLRKKHNIPEKGMGLLVQETVGGDDTPDFSLVVQTNLEDVVRFQTCDGFGEAIVSKGMGAKGEYDKKTGKLVKYVYDEREQRLIESTNLPFISDSTIVSIIEKILSFEQDIGMPAHVGGDYEISGYGDDVYMLQCPEIPMLQDIGSIDDSGLLTSRPYNRRGGNAFFFGYGDLLGTSERRFSHVVWFRGEVDYDKVEGARLHHLNTHLKDYLFIGDIRKRDAAQLIYNASGWIDTCFHAHPGLDHQATLLRAENMLYVNTSLSSDVYERLHIFPKIDTIRSIPANGTLRVNELRGQACLTFDEQ